LRKEEEELLASARKIGDVLWGPEWSLTVTDRDSAAVRDLLPVLIRAGYRASALYEAGRERDGAKAALEAVLIVLQSVRSFTLLGADVPLRALLRALNGLDRGAVEPMLRPMNLTGSRRSLRDILVRGHAAAIAELMRRSGHFLPKSCDLVARRLHAAGYRRTAEDRSFITGLTVYGWRRSIRKCRDGDPIRDVFDRVCSSGAIDFEEPERSVDALVRELRSYVRPDV
jgi:hypothetical protein